MERIVAALRQLRSEALVTRASLMFLGMRCCMRYTRVSGVIDARSSRYSNSAWKPRAALVRTPPDRREWPA